MAKDKEQKNEPIEQYLDSFLRTYQPAIVVPQATHWFSTDEIYRAIKDLNPEAQISKSQVYTAMQDAGFQCQNKPGAQGLQFFWMVKEKKGGDYE